MHTLRRYRIYGAMFHTSNSISNQMVCLPGSWCVDTIVMCFKFKIQFRFSCLSESHSFCLLSRATPKPIYCMLILCNITAVFNHPQSYIEQKKGLELHLFTPLHKLWGLSISRIINCQPSAVCPRNLNCFSKIANSLNFDDIFCYHFRCGIVVKEGSHFISPHPRFRSFDCVYLL